MSNNTISKSFIAGYLNTAVNKIENFEIEDGSLVVEFDSDYEGESFESEFLSDTWGSYLTFEWPSEATVDKFLSLGGTPYANGKALFQHVGEQVYGSEVVEVKAV